MNGSPVECKTAEIPAETKRLAELIERTASLVLEIQGRVSPVLADPVEEKTPCENAPRGDSPLGNWLRDRNEKIEEIIGMLNDLLRRVRL